MPFAAEQSSAKEPAKDHPERVPVLDRESPDADQLARVHAIAGNAAVSSLVRGSVEARDRLALIQSELGRPGEQLEPDIHAQLEAELGRELPAVRVHRDATAESAAAAANAIAFTHGTDIVLGKGVPALSSAQGRRVLAHELVHVVQQAGSRSRSLGLVPPGSRAEQQAQSGAMPAAPMAVTGLARLIERDLTRLSDIELYSEYALAQRYVADQSNAADRGAGDAYILEIEQEMAHRSDRQAAPRQHRERAVRTSAPNASPPARSGSSAAAPATPALGASPPEPRSDAVAHRRRPSEVISAANLREMSADVEFIVDKLKQQVLTSGEEQELVERVRSWAGWDDSYGRSGGTGTPFLDRFLSLLKSRGFSRATFRMAFGLAGREWLSAYDGLFYELEDSRREQFLQLVTRSREGTQSAEMRQMRSVYGYVGKRVSAGFWGIVKNLSTTVTSTSDALVWARWRIDRHPGDPPQITPEVAKQYDEAADAMAKALAEGATPEELEQDRREMMAEYRLGDRWGTIVGILMSVGMAGSGVRAGIPAVAKVAQFAQGPQAVERSARAISARIDAMLKAKPSATWTDFLADFEVRLALTEGLVALIAVVGGVAGATGDKTAVAKFFGRLGLPLLAVANVIPQLERAAMDYTNPKLTEEQRGEALERDVAVIIGSLAAAVGAHFDNRGAFANVRTPATTPPTLEPPAVPQPRPAPAPSSRPPSAPEPSPAPHQTSEPGPAPASEPTPVAASEPTPVPASESGPAPASETVPQTPVPTGEGGGEHGPPPDSEFDFQFYTEGPPVATPVRRSGAPARVLEIGAGPTDTNLGLPVEPGQGDLAFHDPALVDVTRSDIRPRPGVVELNANEPIPQHLRGQDTVIINNPRGYRVDIATVGQAVRPGGRILIQGRAEVVPGMRGINPDMNPILRQSLPGGELPPGYRVVEVVTLPDVPSGTPAAGPGEPGVPRPPEVMGGPHQRTTGGPVSWPNARIVIERLATPTDTPSTPTEPSPAPAPGPAPQPKTLVDFGAPSASHPEPGTPSPDPAAALEATTPTPPAAAPPAQSTPRTQAAGRRVAETETARTTAAAETTSARAQVVAAQADLEAAAQLAAEAPANTAGRQLVREAQAALQRARRQLADLEASEAVAQREHTEATRARARIAALEAEVAALDAQLSAELHPSGGFKPEQIREGRRPGLVPLSEARLQPSGAEYHRLAEARTAAVSELHSETTGLTRSLAEQVEAATPGPRARPVALGNAESLDPALRPKEGAPVDVTTGQPIATPDWAVDHIMSRSDIARDPRFARLTPLQRDDLLLGVPENYLPLTDAANSSKGGLSVDVWIAARAAAGKPIPEAIADALRVADRRARAAIEERFNRYLSQ